MESYLKVFAFSHNHVYYRLSSSVYKNIEEDIFSPENLQQSDVEFAAEGTEKVRVDCIFNITKIYRNENGLIEMININSQDLKEITNPFSALGPQIKETASKWHDKIT